MLLILTNSLDGTADYLAEVLEQASLPQFRVNTDEVIDNYKISYTPAQLMLESAGRSFSPDDFSNVWYRRPEPLDAGQSYSTPESAYLIEEWSAALEGFLAHIPKIRWMNHPAFNTAASIKLEQLTIARRFGFSIPETLLTQDEAALCDFYKRNHGKILVKPLARGRVVRERLQEETVIFANRVPQDALADLDDLGSTPTLFQVEIDKRCDIRVTIVDDDMHAIELAVTGHEFCDIRRNNMMNVSYSLSKLTSRIREQLRAMMRHYSLRFAAVDLVIDANNDWYFLEINPNGQWAWLDEAFGGELSKSFLTSFS